MPDHALVADPSIEVARDPHVSMDEPEFRAFYDATVHPLRAYLTRLCGSAALAGDLTQEAYCRLLAIRKRPADHHGRRRYLFRIATNLVHDHWRRAWRERPADSAPEPVDCDAERRQHLASVIGQALDRVTPRQRALLWLAYVEGFHHREIAAVLGLSVLSVRPLLFRARRRLAHELRLLGLTRSADEEGP